MNVLGWLGEIEYLYSQLGTRSSYFEKGKVQIIMIFYYFKRAKYRDDGDETRKRKQHEV